MRFIYRILLVAVIALSSPILTKSVQAQNQLPQFQTTCLDILSLNKNGVASSVNAPGKQRFPKAVVNRTIFASNSVLDFNKNGVICDKSDIPIKVANFAIPKIPLTMAGIDTELKVKCSLSNLKIDYGFEVGTASLNAKATCTITLRNLDVHYTLGKGALYRLYFYFVLDPPTNSDAISNNKSYFYLPYFNSLSRFFPEESLGEIRPSSQLTSSKSLDLIMTGDKAQVELLYKKMRNGLRPEFYVGSLHASPNATFNTGSRFSETYDDCWNGSGESVSYRDDCSRHNESNYNDYCENCKIWNPAPTNIHWYPGGYWKP